MVTTYLDNDLKQNLKGLIPGYVWTFCYKWISTQVLSQFPVSYCFSVACIVVVMGKMWVRRYSMIKEDPVSKLQKRQYMKLQLGQKTSGQISHTSAEVSIIHSDVPKASICDWYAKRSIYNILVNGVQSVDSKYWAFSYPTTKSIIPQRIICGLGFLLLRILVDTFSFPVEIGT